MPKSKSLTIVIALSVLFVAGYYLWGWPLFMLRYGVAEGTARYKICRTTMGKSMPVEFSYPQNGAQNIPTHSLVVIKLKEGNTHVISSAGIHYQGHGGSSPSVFSGASSEYFIAGNYFPEDALRIDPAFPDKFPDIDISGRIQEFEGYVKSAGTDVQKIASYRTEGAWEANQALVVEIAAACYKPYHLEFKTGQE
jgi:hypothetical protein